MFDVLQDTNEHKDYAHSGHTPEIDPGYVSFLIFKDLIA